MTADIILARPHPFLVNEMSLLLQSGGFSPYRLKSAADLELTAPRAPSGAVISAAISTDSPLSLVEAYTLIRGRYPRLPLVFTALAGFESIARRLRSELQLPAEVEIVAPASNVAHRRGIGTSSLVLLLSDADVSASSAVVLEALTAHFKSGNGR